MIWLGAALVVWAGVSLIGFRWWLVKRYPALPQADVTRLARLEERLTTIELQRGITRMVPGMKVSER